MRDLAESLAYLSRERLGQGKKRAGKKAPTTSWFFFLFSSFAPLGPWANKGAAFPEKVRQCCNAAVW